MASSLGLLTPISGSAQVINAGNNIVLQGSSIVVDPGRNNVLHNSHIVVDPGRNIVLHLLGLLRPASNATRIRAGHVARCDSGTRLEVISQIKQWLNSSNRRTAICWLSGPAGYGKSAVAQTIAERYAAKGRLLGCFFFLRGDGERSHISRLIPTLAYQISISVPAVHPLLTRALRDEPAILGPSVSLAHQFQKLIIEPIHFTTPKVLSCRVKQKIFVIDALDECDDKAEVAAFIDVLLNASPGRSYLPFKILLTSRVEEHIQKKFDHSEAQFLYHLDLRNFDARSDIQAYLKGMFACIFDRNSQTMQRIPKPWPSAKDLTTLLDKTGGSFALAVALIQFIGGHSMPHKALQQLLESGADGLDSLYKQVLNQILGTI